VLLALALMLAVDLLVELAVRMISARAMLDIAVLIVRLGSARSLARLVELLNRPLLVVVIITMLNAVELASATPILVCANAMKVMKARGASARLALADAPVMELAKELER
jgi:hypothetical protein